MIFRKFVESRVKIESLYNPDSLKDMRETINKKMDETIFDEEYLNKKVNFISKKYKNENQEIDNKKM